MTIMSGAAKWCCFGIERLISQEIPVICVSLSTGDGQVIYNPLTKGAACMWTRLIYGIEVSLRAYEGIPDPHYPFHDKTVMVTNCGRLCFYRKKINLSTSLAGQYVGVKEVDDGIWLVSFMQYDLDYIDLEEKALQPLENPFGLKV
jgi:hypothetical protein